MRSRVALVRVGEALARVGEALARAEAIELSGALEARGDVRALVDGEEARVPLLRVGRFRLDVNTSEFVIVLAREEGWLADRVCRSPGFDRSVLLVDTDAVLADTPSRLMTRRAVSAEFRAAR